MRSMSNKPKAQNMDTTEDKHEIGAAPPGPDRRRRWSTEEKQALVRESYAPGMTVSQVARKHGIGISQLFNWRKLEREGALAAVAAGESVVSATELASARAQIAQLQRMLNKKTVEAEILKEAVEYARERKWIARSPWPSAATL
jgi:transposase